MSESGYAEEGNYKPNCPTTYGNLGGKGGDIGKSSRIE